MKVYYDHKTIYRSTNDGIEGIYPTMNSNNEIVVTGVSVISICNYGSFEKVIKHLLNIIGVRLIEKTSDFVPSFYCVPYIEIFAYNKKGCFGLLNPSFEETNIIVHIDLPKGNIKVYKSFMNAIFDIKREKTKSNLEFFSSKIDACHKYKIK